MSVSGRKTIDVDVEKKEKRELALSTASILMDVSAELKELIRWCAIRDFPANLEHLDDPVIKALELGDLHSMTKTVATMETSGYEVFATYSRDWDRVSGELHVNYRKKMKLRVLATEGKNDLYVWNESYYVYEYPPRTLQSVLFFLLNPDVEKRVVETATSMLPNDGRARVEEWFILRNKVKNIDVNIELEDEENRVDETYGSLDLGQHPRIGMFNRIEAFVWNEELSYHVKFYENETPLVYTITYMDKHASIAKLLEVFLSKAEIETVKKEASRVGRVAKKAYVILKVLSKL